MTLYFLQRCETSFFRVTSLCNLKGFLFVIVTLQFARKIASCNMALRTRIVLTQFAFEVEKAKFQELELTTQAEKDKQLKERA